MTTLPRRTLLRGIGGVAIGLPLLDAMIKPGRAHAQAARPKRFGLFFSPNGSFAENWQPTGTEREFTLSTILSPLEPFKQKLVVVQGVDTVASKHGLPANGHDRGMGCLLAATELVAGPSGLGEFGHLFDGSAGGITIDQEIANRIGGRSTFRSLEFGVNASGMRQAILNRISYRAAFQALPAENKPEVAFARIFGELSADPAKFERLRARNQSVLDSITADFNSLLPKVGSNDKKKLDGHLTAIREIEVRLAAPPVLLGGTCKKPTLPATPPRDFQVVGALQMDLMTMALACDLTRVVSLQWGTAQANTRFPFLGVTEAHHSLSHAGDSNAAAKEKLTAIQRWYGTQYASLLDRLSKIPEGNGTLLDSCLFAWCNELGRGNSHSPDNVPWILAGGAGGALATGRYLKYEGTSNNNLFVSFLNLMGVPATTFGNPAYCTGPLPGLA